ncbi:MAG: ABC transporter substrate-binding protein [Bacteroidales bacterium]|nr:ABC transporter substrate-binding protein [Bacteroidales bacterium]
MKPNFWLFLVVLFLQVSFLKAQDEETRYGKTPKEVFPYENFQKAYKYHFLEPTIFYGAGREIPEPKNLKTVRIGFLGPLEGSYIVDLGTHMLQGAQLAIEEANKKGGYKGVPFELMVHNDFGLWGAAANEVVKMDDEKVWAWIGTIDDINSHVAIRATLKLEIPNLNCGDPDPTFTETNIPWVMRVIADDRQAGYALATYIHNKMGLKRVAMMRANNRYGRVGVMEYSDAATRMGFPFIIEERFNDMETEFKPQLERIKKMKPDAILIWGNAKESALIVKQIRALGMTQPLFTSDRVVSPVFLKIAAKDAEGIITTCQYNPEAGDPRLKAFQANYKKKFGVEPNVYSAHAYDAINLIMAAMNKVGLNRALIRDVLSDMKTFQNYQGITGKIVFDATLNDVGDIWMARVNQGKFEFFPTLPMGERRRGGKTRHSGY